MKFSKNANKNICAPNLIFFNEFFFQKYSDNFWHRKVTLKVRNWHFLSVVFGVLVGLMAKWFSEEMLNSNVWMHGFMFSTIKKSWKVSTLLNIDRFSFFATETVLGQHPLSVFDQEQLISVVIWLIEVELAGPPEP